MLFRAIEKFVLIFLLISSFADHVSASMMARIPRPSSKDVKPIRAYDFKNVGNCLSDSSGLIKYCSYDGGLMSHHQVTGKKRHIVSFIHKETAESIPGHHLKQQLDNGVVSRDWTDILDNSWAVYILKAAAIPVAGGIFVKGLDFAYAAIRGSSALADAWAAASPYVMRFARGATSLISRGLASFSYSSTLPGPGGRKRNCEPGDTYSYVDPGTDCDYWMNPTKDPNGGDFPSDDALAQFSEDFGTHMQNMGEDDAEGGISPASYSGSDPGHNEVLGAGVSCGNAQEREVDEC